MRQLTWQRRFIENFSLFINAVFTFFPASSLCGRNVFISFFFQPHHIYSSAIFYVWSIHCLRCFLVVYIHTSHFSLSVIHQVHKFNQIAINFYHAECFSLNFFSRILHFLCWIKKREKNRCKAYCGCKSS